MKLTKRKTEFGTDVILEEDTKFIRFSFGGNLDLYWSIHSKEIIDENKDSFIITKENYKLFKLFNQLFADVENINIFDEDEFIPFFIETEEDKKEYLEEKRKDIEERKNRYRLFNHSNYNELFDSKNRTITWYSDETAHEVANYLIIKQEKDLFRIEFYIQPYIEGFDEDFHSPNYIPIRFRNSGSSYDPFNGVFMKMYNNLNEIDDINEVGHQIHIEEYLYGITKKLIKK